MQLQDKFYKSTEVSDILGVSLRTLYRYMETGKIQSVHLPSGRHRFTKDQIEAFLFASKYMTFDNNEEKPKNIIESTSYSQNINADVRSDFVKSEFEGTTQKPNLENTQTSTPAEFLSQSQVPPISKPSTDIDNELEQLLKSLEEDEKNSNDSASDTQLQNQSVNNNINSSNTAFNNDTQEDDLDAFLKSLEKEEVENKPQSSFTSILNDTYGVQTQPKINVNENEVKYYYCPFNDLKSIAKMIKKIGDNENKNYAFTMNAGLSLFFPLDLFSMIHFYVNVNDLNYFEKELELKPSTKSEANLAILLTEGDAFVSVKEVSGFRVVRKDKIIENLKANGMVQLASEAELRL